MKKTELAMEKKVLPGTLRQREYRRKHLKDGNDQRVQVILSPGAKLAMDRMAKHLATTRKEVLERVLLDAEDALLKSLDAEQAALYCDALKAAK